MNNLYVDLFVMENFNTTGAICGGGRSSGRGNPANSGGVREIFDADL